MGMTIEQIERIVSNEYSNLKGILDRDGVVVVRDFLNPTMVQEARTEVKHSLRSVRAVFGLERLSTAGEFGVVRAPMKQSPSLLSLLHETCLRGVALSLLGNGAICHLMNGLVLEPNTPGIREVFQGRFHQDFPRYLNGYRASINTFLCLDDFSVANGATRFIVGSHLLQEAPRLDDQLRAVTAEARAGSLIVFDSTVWHSAGENTTTNDRIGLNVQWTRSFIKQQIDLVRYMGEDFCSTLDESIQASLGMHSRVATTLDEYYLPKEQRLYRAGQG